MGQNDRRRNLQPPQISLQLYTRWAMLITAFALCQTVLLSCSMPDESPDQTANEVSSSPSSEQVITLNGPGQLLPVTALAQMKGETFEIEVAKTSSEQALGLMFRSALPDNRGMLFPFSPPRRVSFWMKDVPVALDMVFLREGEVVAIAPEVPPCPALPCSSYGPDDQIVDQVLELRSGRAAEIDLQVGDTVSIEALPGYSL
ncbi:DUF192 domain-containing protein [cf. Phormidesmis sp. LEGE 11477]|nr:DUF192 domain-containing protein [cf. Phormidesmis sp. LEGE 11477]